jgi:hypothetical protein
MKINNITAADITIPGLVSVVPASGVYSVDPDNDDLDQMSKSELFRALINMGSLTLLLGDIYTPSTPTAMEEYLDKIANGIFSPMAES